MMGPDFCGQLGQVVLQQSPTEIMAEFGTRQRS